MKQTDLQEVQSREIKSLSSGLSWKILLPVFLGLAVVAWLFYDDFKPEVWREIKWDAGVIGALALGFLFVVGRDFGMTWRFRCMTEGNLSWRSALRVCMLCEFTSAVTPTAVGGSAVGMVFLNREGIPLGRAITLMMTTIFLDELFLTVACPIMLLFVDNGALFGFDKGNFSVGLESAFWIIYGFIALWTLLLFLGIIIAPMAIKRFLMKVMSFKWLRRWRDSVERTADNMIDTSKDIKGKSIGWWLKGFAATAVSWTSRFLLVNMLFLAFCPSASQLIVFARQLVVWVILMVTPTPGGSGVSEWLFTEYYGDLIGSAGLALIIALFWRLFSYYIYLVIGACILPAWLKRGFSHNKKTE